MSHQNIRRSILSTNKIQQITRAMELMSGNHMSHALNWFKHARRYHESLENIIQGLDLQEQAPKHPWLTPSPLKGQLIVVYGSDRGLCGALNLNTFKLALEQAQQANIPTAFITIGEKAKQFFLRRKADVRGSWSRLGLHPRLETLSGLLPLILEGYHLQEWQKVLLVYPKYINTMVQKPTAEVLLPIQYSASKTRDDVLYEPDVSVLIDWLLRHRMTSHLYRAALETSASEQSARMLAMKSATDNAESLKKTLERRYHKERQATITREIAEIVAGIEE